MSKALVKKYVDLLNKGHRHKISKLFHSDAYIIDHEGNMREKSAIHEYYCSSEHAFRLHKLTGKDTKFRLTGALEHENKSIRLRKEFTIHKNRIKSIVMSRH